jgi:dCMP deaminase
MNNTERKRPSWDEYGMLLAYAAAQRSPDPYVQVGATTFKKDRSTAGTGYNGAASGVELDWSDRDARRPFVKHAEYNCLEHSTPGEPYYLYVTLSPCKSCLALAAKFGVQEIIYDQLYYRDIESLTSAKDLGITIRQLSLPNEYRFKNHIISSLE